MPHERHLTPNSISIPRLSSSILIFIVCDNPIPNIATQPIFIIYDIVVFIIVIVSGISYTRSARNRSTRWSKAATTFLAIILCYRVASINPFRVNINGC
jgi:chromate transport protein ChrA